MPALHSIWRPILEGEQRERAMAVVGTIADDLRARFGEASPLAGSEAWALADGRSGVAVFFAYLGEATGDDAARLLATTLLQDALESAAAEPMTANLFEGFTGVAWTLAHLDGWLLDLSDGDPNDAVDAALLQLTGTSPWNAEYDLLTGLVGIGVYALERLPRPGGAELLERVVARLAERAERSAAGATWFTPPDRLPPDSRRDFPRGAYDLGVAHGIPGVIAFLAAACDLGYGGSPARALLDGAVAWLLGQRLPSGAGASFAALVGPGAAVRAARSAWCYGDPGAAAALFRAGRRARVHAWEVEAVALAEQAADRPLAECGVVDAGFCHGSAGLAHMFNRLYQATGAPVLHAAAGRWLAPVLDEYAPGGSARPGFLDGAAGIGLALLAAATPVEPRWDRLFLLS